MKKEKEKKKIILTDTIIGLSYNLCIWIRIYECHHLYWGQLILLQTNLKLSPSTYYVVIYKLFLCIIGTNSLSHNLSESVNHL